MLMPQDVVRRWFEARQAQVGRFSSWGTAVPKASHKVPTSRNELVTQPRPYQRGHPRIRVNLCCTKEDPCGEQCMITDMATLYK